MASVMTSEVSELMFARLISTVGLAAVCAACDREYGWPTTVYYADGNA